MHMRIFIAKTSCSRGHMDMLQSFSTGGQKLHSIFSGGSNNNNE